MDSGVFAELVRSTDVPLRYFARSGSGAKQKRRWWIGRHFTSYRTKVSWRLQWLSPPEERLSTDIFQLGDVMHSMRQHERRSLCPNRSGRYCVGSLGRAQLPRL